MLHLFPDHVPVLLTTDTSGIHCHSQIMNLTLTPLNGEDRALYLERMDFPITELLDDLDYKYYNQQVLKDVGVGSTSVVDGEDINVDFHKNHDIKLERTLIKYLHDLSSKYGKPVRFVVENPVSWLYFLSTFVTYEKNTPLLPRTLYYEVFDLTTYAELTPPVAEVLKENVNEEVNSLLRGLITVKSLNLLFPQ